MSAASSLIASMIDAARKAARGLARDFGEVTELQGSKKGAADYVSAADIKAEQVLFEALEKARPGYSFLGEERGLIEGTDKSHRWIVDPLDGTTNFLHSIPHFAISVALERGKDVVAGMIYNPVLDEMYWAERGHGAFLNDRRLRVSARRDLSSAVIGTGIPFQTRGDHPAYLKTLAAVMARTAGVRRIGAAALDLAYVAAGRFDGFWESDLNAWDVAAGILMVREAGGFVEDIDGRDTALNTGNIIATNGHLLGPLGRIVRNAAKESPQSPA
jgi:myo-inositol-1(or 4)-monophosphatase